VSAGACTFAIEVRRADGSLAGVVSDASLSCCVDDAWFRGVQAGQLPNGGRLPALRVVPTWHDGQRPAITGLSVSLGGDAARHYAREVFATEARALIQRLVGEGRLEEGEKVTWSVIAHEAEPASPRPAAVRADRAPFPFEPASLPHTPRGGYEICLDAALLRRLGDRILRTRSVEGAELLVGHLRHDAERDALELRIVDVLPLEPGSGGSSTTHFSFDPVATAAARRRVLERDDGALPCGWHHNHNPCEGCWEHADCKVDWVFFSADDREVHATLFASPQMVALVGGKLGDLPATRPGFRLYGWRDGRVVERPFRVFGEGAGEWDPKQGTFRDEASTPARSAMIQGQEEAQG
jgi:hypothetical protein